MRDAGRPAALAKMDTYFKGTCRAGFARTVPGRLEFTWLAGWLAFERAKQVARSRVGEIRLQVSHALARQPGADFQLGKATRAALRH